MKNDYFTNILCSALLPVFAAIETVFQMTKCDAGVDPAWILLARLVVSDGLQCARACYAANSTCDHVSFYQGTCMLWQGEAACGSSHVYVVDHSCDEGWYRYKGSCYLPVAQTKTWADSAAHCESLGAHLVSIHSLEEHTFIVDLTFSLFPSWSGFWIGASDVAVDGVWEWVSGEPWDFENWGSGEPSHSYAGKDEDWTDELKYTQRKKKRIGCSDGDCGYFCLRKS